MTATAIVCLFGMQDVAARLDSMLKHAFKTAQLCNAQARQLLLG